MKYYFPDEDPVQRCSHERSVRFVDELVTGYSEAYHSPFHKLDEEEATTAMGHGRKFQPKFVKHLLFMQSRSLH